MLQPMIQMQTMAVCCHGCNAHSATKAQPYAVFATGIFAETFTRLRARNVVPEVLYPAVQLPPQSALQASQQHWHSLVAPQLAAFMQAGPLFVSINRFERKKVWFAP